MGKTSPNDPATAARDLAERALVHVVAREDLLGEFVAASGVRGDAVRAMVARPEFPGFMLDFILGNDRRVQDFAREEGIAPEQIRLIRMRLDAGAGEWPG